MSALTAAEPRWRIVMTDTESESGVAPMCPQQSTEGGSHYLPGFDTSPNLHSVYDCCPGPHIECWSPLRARQLVYLLNEIEAEICSRESDIPLFVFDAHRREDGWLDPAQADELRKLTATCSCGTSPMTYEVPQPDCPVHGAVRALNQAMAEQRHDFDESSVLNPATGKPYPILWGEDNQPDPLCRCGAFWFSSDGGCQSLVEELRREREHRAAWLPVIDAARVLIREVKAARASKARSDIAIAGDALGPLLAAVDALDRGVPDR